MIFYFSGTGNSKHVAEKIANSTCERMVYMSRNTILKNATYQIHKDEKIGFIFPVYWYTLPTIVEELIQHLTLSGYENQYVYGIATYAIAAGHAMDTLIHILKNEKIKVSGIFGVKMVDNYVIGYNIVDAQQQKRILNNADVEIEKIISMINQGENTKYINEGLLAFVTPITRFGYRKTNHTKKFFVTQACNGCKQCVRECPCNAIQMESEKPKWVGDCTFCLKCLHGCRQSAIQYGKFTQKRNRYQYFNV